MSDERPNIVFFLWDNFAWAELGCYGGGVLRGAPTRRIDALAAVTQPASEGGAHRVQPRE